MNNIPESETMYVVSGFVETQLVEKDHPPQIEPKRMSSLYTTRPRVFRFYTQAKAFAMATICGALLRQEQQNGFIINPDAKKSYGKLFKWGEENKLCFRDNKFDEAENHLRPTIFSYMAQHGQVGILEAPGITWLKFIHIHLVIDETTCEHKYNLSDNMNDEIARAIDTTRGQIR